MYSLSIGTSAPLGPGTPNKVKLSKVKHSTIQFSFSYRGIAEWVCLYLPLHSAEFKKNNI